nr:twitching motility protein PilT [uncultured Catonella sp.]
MVHIICGEKGKGKTKVILEKANEAIKTSGGNVVFLDKDMAHMYELNNKIRLINVKDFLVENSGEFIGFICGIISQDHDLEAIFLDSFLKISFTDEKTMKPVLDKIIQIADKYSVDIILSLSVKSEDIPEEYRHNVLVSL